MIRRALQSVLIVIAILAIVVACAREGGAGKAGETQTIAPAAGHTSPTDTDAMTQTVSIEDGRSEADGGVLTSPNQPKPPDTTTAEKKTSTTKSRPPGRTQ